MANIIVTDAGFSSDDWGKGLLDWDVTTNSGWEPDAGYGLDVPNTLSADQLAPFLGTVDMIRIAFPAFHDGRGFSLARHLRLLGYSKRLRAFGHVLADQYAMARRCGFDEVEIDEALAQRQPEQDWLFRAKWSEHSYQNLLRKAV